MQVIYIGNIIHLQDSGAESSFTTYWSFDGSFYATVR